MVRSKISDYFSKLVSNFLLYLTTNITKLTKDINFTKKQKKQNKTTRGRQK